MAIDTMGSQDTSAAAAPAITPDASAEPKSFADDFNTWTPAEQRAWAVEGKEPQRQAAAPVAEPESEPAKAEPEPESDPGTKDDDDDDAPKIIDTSTAQGKRDAAAAFAKVKRERAQFKARLAALERQLADTPKAGAAPAAIETPAGEKPKLRLPNPADFDNAEDYARANEAAILQILEGKQAESANRSAIGALRERTLDLGADIPDFEGTLDALPITWPLLAKLSDRRDGPKLLHYFATHPDELTALANETNVAADITSYDAVVKRIASDSALARTFGRAEARVDIEIHRILAAMKEPKQAPPAAGTPKPITQTRVQAPGQRVAPQASSMADPIEEALARGDVGKAAELEVAKMRQARYGR